MKKLSTLLIFFCCITLVACDKGQVVNGTSIKSAYRSVKGLKKRLQPENQIEFEVSFWMLRDAYKDNKAFLDVIDGKKPDEIIALGKEIYQKRKNEGFKEYAQYSSWEEMITKFGRERIDQENRHSSKQEGQKSDQNVLYKL